MERLTEKHYLAEDHYMKCSEACNVDMDCVDCPAHDKLVERLAAYEDTGLEPEEVLPKDKADEIALKLMCLAELESFCSYDRLHELAEADKAGRCVVLPCVPGDTLWLSQLFYTQPQGPLPALVHAIRFDADGIMIVTGKRRFAAEAIGKTVFYTREEAERAMEEKKNGDKTSL